MLIRFMSDMDENNERVAYHQMINGPSDGVLTVLILVNGHRRGVQRNPIFRWIRRRHSANKFKVPAAATT